MTTKKTVPSIATPACTSDQVAEMLQEKVEAFNRHCRTQAVKGAYKTGGRTSSCRIPPVAIDHYQRMVPRQ